MRRVAVLVFVLLGLVPRAEALTIRDIVELSRAGLGEEVLIALIEVDRGVYAIDTATLTSLKQAGVSDRVIVALIRSGREQPAPQPMPEVFEPEPASPPLVVIEHHHEAPQVQQVMVPVPVYVAVPTLPRHHRGVRPAVGPAVESTFVPFQSGPPAVRPQAVQPAQPVYWGFGGQLRPDAWQPAGHSGGESARKPEGRRDRR